MKAVVVLISLCDCELVILVLSTHPFSLWLHLQTLSWPNVGKRRLLMYPPDTKQL